MYNFILNPTAGKGKSVSIMKKISSFLEEKGLSYEIHTTSYPFHAIELAKQLTLKGCENLITVGGDGTINEVLNGMENIEKCPLGIIPSGTGNDFAKSANIPLNPIEAMQKIIDGTPIETDFLLLNDKRVINITGMGMDVTVLERCKRMKVFKGKLQYFISLLVTLMSFKWHKFTVSIDDNKPVEKTVLLVAACNGKYFGGGMPVSPKSDISDNYINVIIVNKLKKWKIPFVLLDLYRGKLLKHPFVENILCKKISISTDNSHKSVNIDGELYKYLPFNCSLIKNSLKIFR